MLLGVLLYGVAVAVTGYGRLRESLGTFRWSAFALALALSSSNYSLRFLRWQLYLGRLGVRGIPAADSLLVFLSGFVLTVTPGKVGEVFKSAVLEQTHGVPLERTAPIVVAERLSDVLGVVALILLGSTAFAGGLPWAVAGALAVGLGLGLILWEKPARALLAWVRAHPRLYTIEPKLEEALRSLRLLSSPAALLGPLVLSVLAWAAEGVGLWLLLDGFGETAPVLLSVFFYETASLAGALIPLPGGLGVVETMLQTQLVHLGGVSPGSATAAMLLIRFATLWWAVAVGFAALALLRRRFPALRGA